MSDTQKIFVLSLHRSGTQSTHDLLLRSGRQSIHWPSNVDGEDYESLAIGQETDYSALLGQLAPVIEAFDAFSDVPFPALYEELYAAYPAAYFLAVHRSPYDWLNSIRTHIGERELDPYEKVQYWKYLTERPRFMHDLPDERLLEMHIRHYANLLRFFSDKPNFRLFHLSDPQAGEKICDFLGMPPLKLGHIDTTKAA